MPAPESATYSAAAKAAAHTAFRDLLDAGSAAAYVAIRNDADTLLAQITLDDPSGSVDGVTGQLTLTPDGPDPSADASGTAAYGEICDSDGNVHLSLPAQAGTAPVSGYIVMNTLSVVSGTPVSIVSATIG